MLEDVVVITRLLVFGDWSSMGIILEDKAKLQDLVSTMQSSRTSGKSTYAPCIRHFEEGEGRESDWRSCFYISCLSLLY